MLAFRPRSRKEQSRPARPESAERRLGQGLDQRRVRLRKFEDVFRSADEAEAAMMYPKPSAAFRRFFMPMAMAYARRLATVEARMDPSFPSASGARLTTTLLL
jgi:hypothetical protein